MKYEIRDLDNWYRPWRYGAYQNDTLLMQFMEYGDACAYLISLDKFTDTRLTVDNPTTLSVEKHT